MDPAVRAHRTPTKGKSNKRRSASAPSESLVPWWLQPLPNQPIILQTSRGPIAIDTKTAQASGLYTHFGSPSTGCVPFGDPEKGPEQYGMPFTIAPEHETPRMEDEQS